MSESGVGRPDCSASPDRNGFPSQAGRSEPLRRRGEHDQREHERHRLRERIGHLVDREEEDQAGDAHRALHGGADPALCA